MRDFFQAIYESHLVELPLASFFLSKLLGQVNADIDHLSSLDPELYKNLLYLKVMIPSRTFTLRGCLIVSLLVELRRERSRPWFGLHHCQRGSRSDNCG